MAMQKLPKDVRYSIRSGLALASTSQCITELVLNSLDAGADSIIIRLDIAQFKLEVDDNGCGITLDDLQYVGNRYYTSKCRTLLDLHSNLNSNGFRGEALACLSESCRTLVIVTRPKNLDREHAFQRSFNCGKPLQPIRNTSGRKSSGTTITVLDFMYNAPVRQKRIIPNIDMEEIRVQVEGLALSHPHVSFTIVDESEKSIVRQIPSTSGSLETFSHLYGQEIAKNLCPIGPLTLKKLNINGYISRSSYHNKRLQFIFVNGRLVKGTKLHKLINMIMRKSDVLRGNGPWQELPMPERVRDFLWVSNFKKRDRFCVFMVNISCPVTEYDITLDPKKTLIEFCDWDTLLECMENVVKNFLKEHNLAFVALDQGVSNSQSSDESPMSIINEMEQLEREDALGQKLSQFKCPKEISRGTRKETIGESKTLKMARAICSVPAKRNLRFPFGKRGAKRQPPYREKTKGDVNDKIQVSNMEHSVCSEVDSKKAGAQIGVSDCTELITYPLFRDSDLEIHTPVQHLDESKKSSYQFGLKPSVEDYVGSLGKFRNNFIKTQVLSQKTPDDVQKIKVVEPPPIIRRPVPLEHRVKGCWNVQLLKKSGIIAETFSKVPGNIDVHTKGPISLGHINSSTFDNTLVNNTRENGDVGPKTTSSHEPYTSSGNILKTDAMTFASTQTERDSWFFREKTNVQDMVEESIKPNLKNLSLRMKLFQNNFGSKDKIKVFKYGNINTEGERPRGESLNNPHTSSMPVLIRNKESNHMCLFSKLCESSEPSKSKKFLTSEDFICSLEKENETLGEDYKRRITDKNHSNSTEKCPIASVSMENTSSDCEKVYEHMPVLEPYFSSTDFDTLPTLCDLNDTPPCLLEFENHSIQPDRVELSNISGCSKTTTLDGKKRKSFYMLTEECSSSKHFRDLDLSSESSFEEKLKRSVCFISPKTKPVSYLCNRSPLVTSGLHHEENVTESSNWVTVDNSSPNGDVAHVLVDSALDQTLKDRTLKNTQSISAEESIPHCITRDKNGHFTHDTESGMCSEIVSDSDVAVDSEFSSSDGIEVKLKQYTPDVENGSTALNKRQCLKYSFPNSADDSTSLISSHEPSVNPDGDINSLKSKKGNLAMSDKVTPVLFQGTQDQKVTSPFFSDSTDWDAALLEMCHDAECQKATDCQKCQLNSILAQNNNEKLQNKDSSCHQEEKFEMFARQPFLPKGLSPVMPIDLQEGKMKNGNGTCCLLSSQAENDLHTTIKECSVVSDELAWIKWGGENEKGPMKDLLCRTISEQDKSGKRIMKSFLSAAEDDKLYLESEVLSARIENQSKSFIKVFNLIHPCTFSKDILTNFKLLGKLDRKFIVAKIGLKSESVSTPIVLFDQHAVHERIRLEKLIQEYQVKDKGKGNSDTEFIRFKSVPITSTLEISLSITEARLMEKFRKNFQILGLVYDIDVGDGIGSNDATVKINEIPACLSSKELKEAGPLGLKAQVHSLIREQVENLMATRGIGTYSPTILREAINMKACRGAVKFGDPLTDQECRWLLKKLSTCDTPFQCAHGRPSMYPIVDLGHLGKFCRETKKDIKPRLWRLKKMMEHVKAYQDKCLAGSS